MLETFVTLDLIGSGAAAKVYRGTKSDGSEYAIKVLQDTSEPQLRHFFREVQITARLNHHSIISIQDFGSVPNGHMTFAEGAGYYIAEFVERGAFQPGEILNWSGMKRFFVELLEGLAHAHARGVVHRDLKPENILIRGARGELGETTLRPSPIIADFGIAHRFVGLEKSTVEIAGTPLFMAPEQFVSARHVGPWSDIYSVGCMFWLCATGSHLFDYETTPAIALAHYNEELPRFQPRFNVPEGFEAVLSRMLEKSALDRYQFAADVLEELAALRLERPDPQASEALPIQNTPTLLLDSGDTEIMEAFEGLPTGRETKKLKSVSVGRWKIPSHTGTPVSNIELFALKEGAFRGRENSCPQIWRILDQVASTGLPKVAVVRGAFGVGRSRLATQIGRQAHETGYAYFWQTSANKGEDAFDLLWRTVQNAFQLHNASARTIQTLLNDRFPKLDDELVSKIAGELGSDAIGSTTSFAQFSSSTKRLEAFRDLIRVACDRPVILQIDDVERAHGWERIVSFLTAQTIPLLIILTMSEESNAPGDPAITDLKPLTSDSFVNAITSQIQISHSVAAALEMATKRNIGFAVDLLNYWFRNRHLSLSEDVWDGNNVPLFSDHNTLRNEIVRQAIGKLSPNDQTALAVGAALGEIVDELDWLDVCERLGCEPSPQFSTLIERDSLGDFHNAMWSFKQPSDRLTVLSSSVVSPRKIHQAAIESIKNRYRVTARGISERIARHLLMLGDHDGARHEIAQELRRTANDADTDYCLRLFRFRNQIPHSDTTAEDVEMMALEAQFIAVAGDIERAVDLLNSTQKLADKNSPVYADVVRSKGVLLRNLGHYKLSDEAFADALTRFEKLADNHAIARTLMGRIAVLRYLGNHQEALDSAKRAIALLEEPSWKVMAEREYGRLLLHFGRPAEALTIYESALEKFRTQNLRYIETELLMDLGSIFIELRDYEKAVAYIEEAWDAMHKVNDVNIHKAVVLLAQAHAAFENYDELVSALERLETISLGTILHAYSAEKELLKAGAQSLGIYPGDWRASVSKFEKLQRDRPIVNIEILRAAKWTLENANDRELIEISKTIYDKMVESLGH